MIPFLIAMPGSDYYRERNIGLLLLAVATGWFLWRTATRRDEKQRRQNLGWLALLTGLISGLAIGLLTITLNEFSPLDRWP